MLRVALLALLLAAPAMAQHNVWVVAKQPGAGVDFTDPWSAVFAATSGDTILVKAGNYGQPYPHWTELTLPAKTLSITADTGAVVDFGATTLRNMPEGYLLTLSRINFTSPAPEQAGLALEDCAGAVWLDHCTLTGFEWVPQMQLNPSPALKVIDCASVVVTHSQLVGKAAGLQAQNSNVYGFRSTITGGPAKCMPNWSPQCTNGGAGVWAKGGLVALQSCLVNGGAPSASPECKDVSVPFFGCTCWSFAGPALRLEAGAQVEAYDVQLTSDGAPPCGFAGSTTDIVSGQFNPTAGPGFEITGPSPLRVGQGGSFDVTGQPGDAAWAVLAIPPAAIWTPKFHGPWLTGGDFIFLFMGTLPGSGGLSFSFTVPPLPPGFESVEFIAQGVRVAPGTGTLLADPYRGILIDGSF